MTVYFLVGLPILVVGAALIVTGGSKAAALEARGLPAGTYRTRRGIGLGVAGLACVLMKVGSITSDIPGWLTLTTDLTVMVSVAVLAALLGRRRISD
ncbi:hypothetical protein [Prescottella agglutinans]|uniref:DUF3784 domain-containing protein n=1 Tax=Prescottella agglutinans TaxID=1644129 RepID=A0ABT6M7B5_9NOCA|nr:hypothetical protein [Prescottella agglutinans]MDH6279794.1 hypothetical protein [Prescottella agglutinans]